MAGIPEITCPPVQVGKEVNKDGHLLARQTLKGDMSIMKIMSIVQQSNRQLRGGGFREISDKLPIFSEFRHRGVPIWATCTREARKIGKKTEISIKQQRYFQRLGGEGV